MVADTVARWCRSWQRMRLEAMIMQIDREIDGIRSMRRYEEEIERDLDEVRTTHARRLQALAQHDVNCRSRANVRGIRDVR